MNTPLLSRFKRWLKGQMLKRMHGMLTCREFEEFVLAYLDGELTQKQLTRFNLHLRICRECRDYMAAYQRALDINKAVLGASEEPVPDDVPDDLIKAILEARR